VRADTNKEIPAVSAQSKVLALLARHDRLSLAELVRGYARARPAPDKAPLTLSRRVHRTLAGLMKRGRVFRDPEERRYRLVRE
jgi:DNA-binding IclR family transcriptional regulator